MAMRYDERNIRVIKYTTRNIKEENNNNDENMCNEASREKKSFLIIL